MTFIFYTVRANLLHKSEMISGFIQNKLYSANFIQSIYYKMFVQQCQTSLTCLQHNLIPFNTMTLTSLWNCLGNVSCCVWSKLSQGSSQQRKDSSSFRPLVYATVPSNTCYTYCWWWYLYYTVIYQWCVNMTSIRRRS